MRRQHGHKDARDVTFVYEPKAKGARVFLAGDFNGWEPTLCPMERKEERFEATLRLPPGEYAYKFVVDGKLINDPAGEMQIWQGPGSVTSVVRVGV